MNYTKDEWEINETTSCPTKITALGGFTIASANKRVDAHLIAAAPDMYEALKKFIGATESANNPQFSPRMSMAYSELKQALSKAAGK